jgi:hypothetical protein
MGKLTRIELRAKYKSKDDENKRHIRRKEEMFLKFKLKNDKNSKDLKK